MIAEEYKNKGFIKLYYIVHIDNIKSICESGIYSHNMIIRKNIPHIDFSNQEVQNLRNNKYICESVNLHDFVNLFFNPRNSMLYNLLKNYTQSKICILEIDADVLNEYETYVSDGNVSKNLTKVYKPIDGLEILKYNEIFCRDWDDSSPIIKDIKRSKVSAEVLVKDFISPNKIHCIYVANTIIKDMISKCNIGIKIEINEDLFFK